LIARLRNQARAWAKATSLAAELRWRRPPQFQVSPLQVGEPTVYYLTPHRVTPSGGVRNMYRHVDVLNAAGHSAAVVHAPSGFRVTWFSNTTRVLGAREVRLGPRDILVVPEVYASGFDHLPVGPRIVVFNQAAYHTFDFIPFAGTGPGAPYAQVANLVGLLAVSRANEALLRYAFPQVPVHVARLVIDPDVFRPADQSGPADQSAPADQPRPADQPGPTDRPGPGDHARRARLAFVPHRRTADREHLLHLLRARGITDRWALAPIDGRSERETAEIMRGSAIFLSFSERDGFGLPPAEAMASGCYVVGFTGIGGQEFFDPADCRPVPEGDLLQFAREVDEACTAYQADPDTITKLGRSASERVLSRYTMAGLAEDLDQFYAPLLNR
jgi:glycosyl transferase family 1